MQQEPKWDNYNEEDGGIDPSDLQYIDAGIEAIDDMVLTPEIVEDAIKTYAEQIAPYNNRVSDQYKELVQQFRADSVFQKVYGIHEFGLYSIKELAKTYGCSRDMISNYCQGIIQVIRRRAIHGKISL